MKSINYVLICDGSSDKVLMQIINWLFNDLFPAVPINGNFADYRRLPNPPKKGEIIKQVSYAKNLYYPCDIIFYHRDAEEVKPSAIAKRKSEINNALPQEDNVICIVPVAMMDAWLLLENEAIKKAAGNRLYKNNLKLPLLQKIETIKDPKKLLHQALADASGLTGRRLSKFNVQSAVHLVAENIKTFEPLRQLQAFQIFENDLKQLIFKIIQK
jgi:hypothetical protein